jgi:hypothetical protein
MAKTKITPRKEGYRCPMCCLRINEEREWEEHVLDCGRKRREKRFECQMCDYASNKKSDLGRHCRTRHGGVGTATAGSGTDEEWQQQDPGNLSDVVGGTEQSNAESGESCKRKPTRPAPVTSTKRKIAGKDFLVQYISFNPILLNPIFRLIQYQIKTPNHFIYIPLYLCLIIQYKNVPISLNPILICA